MKEIFKKIDELSNDFVNVWEDILNIESPSNFKEGVDKVGSYFIDENGHLLVTFKDGDDGLCFGHRYSNVDFIILRFFHLSRGFLFFFNFSNF